jgi:hypothetical protein
MSTSVQGIGILYIKDLETVEKSNSKEADGKCPYARLPNSRGMRRKNQVQGARQKAEGKNQGHLHYLSF